MSKFCAALLATALAAAAPAATAGDWSGEAGIGYDSNVANIREGGDERSDRFAQLAVGLDRRWRFDERQVLLWRLQLDAQQFEEFQGLSNLQAGLQGRWLYKPASGFHAPLLELLAGTARWEFDSGLRDSTQHRLGLFATVQLTTRIGLRAGAQTRWRRGDSEVFDTRVHSLVADLDWTLRPGLVLYLGYQALDGDLISTAPADTDTTGAADAAEADDVFPGEIAFRLSSRAHIGTLGFNYALSSRLSLDLQAREIHARSDAGVRYERSQLLGSLLWRY